MDKPDFTIKTLGEPTIDSPVRLSSRSGDHIVNYTDDSERIVYDIAARSHATSLSF